MGAGFVLGLLAGLAVGALVVLALLRSTARITGAAPRALPGLVLDGLLPAGPANGITVQRRLARRVKRTGERTAAGRRVAASSLEVHVSPEDHAAIEDAMGVEAAERDLLEFYTAHAGRSGWIVGATPTVAIVRDISLRPRQAFVRAETRVDPASIPPVEPRPATGSRPVVAPRRDTGVTDVLPPDAFLHERGTTGITDVLAPGAFQDGAAPAPDVTITDVLPRAEAEGRGAPIGLAEEAAPGDLLVVHGTDVRVVPARRGLATVGRAAHNDIVVDAPGVAADHLLLERRQQQWWVVPGPSGAATALDGRAVRRAERVHGQGVVELGRGARLRLAVEGGR